MSITPKSRQVLEQLLENGPQSIEDLALATNRAVSSVNGTILDLTNKGYANRHKEVVDNPMNHNDIRIQTIVNITEAGKSALENEEEEM